MANEQRGGSGNFANDPERASEAGKKGRQQQQSGGSKGQQGGRHQPLAERSMSALDD
jgi:general stress protein YciG